MFKLDGDSLVKNDQGMNMTTSITIMLCYFGSSFLQKNSYDNSQCSYDFLSKTESDHYTT